jgi:hypothetical protein
VIFICLLWVRDGLELAVSPGSGVGRERGAKEAGEVRGDTAAKNSRSLGDRTF